jgi:DNA-binding LacI/PurR family transcriptional regulator
MPAPSDGDLIADYIKKQNFEPGTRLPSERKLAAVLGLTHAAVNRAILLHLGRGSVVREGYKLYVADLETPAPLPTILALITGDGPSQSISETANDCGCQLLMPECHELSDVRRVLRDLAPNQIHGVVLWRLRGEELLAALAARGIPIIVAGRESSLHHNVRADFAAAPALVVEHLVQFGHRRLAFVCLPVGGAAYTVGRRDEIACYRQSCERQGLASSAELVHEIASDAQAEVALAWEKISAASERVTGILCYNPLIARHLLRLAKKAGLSIPRDLSLVSLRDDASSLASEPSLTAIYDQAAAVARLSLFLLSDMIRHPTHGDLRRRKDIRLSLCLLPRGSSAAAPGWSGELKSLPATPTPITPLREWAHASFWSPSLRQRLAEVEQLNARPFPLRPGHFVGFAPLDLSRQANRSASREHGWLGDEPFRHLPSGEVYFHGIPFNLLDEKTNDGHNVVVLRSRKAHSGAGKPLPLSSTFTVRRKAQALYFLHAAGWTVRHLPIADYEFLYEDDSSARPEVIPYGPHQPTESESEALARREHSTIQDWHPSYPRLESSHALPCLITEGGDPLLYERYLYVWQWINPHPERRIRAIRARIIQPDNRATLAVLAVTLQQV